MTDEFTYLNYSFLTWMDEQRMFLRGNNRLKPQRMSSVLSLMYKGMRLREIARLTRVSKVTLGGVRLSLSRFCSEHPVFTKPKCACGSSLWHRGVCPVWDTYHAEAIANGHKTQRRLSRLNQANIFFESIEQTKIMNSIKPTSNKANITILKFSDLVQQGINAWTEAGKILVSILDDNPEARADILDLCPDITEEILARFEAIGRNQLHPKTLLNNSPGMRRLRQLPFSEQTKYVSDAVPVLIRTSAGIDTLNVSVKNLTSLQAQQVFSSNGVRPLDAQRAWIESRSSRMSTKGAPYRIKGNKVVFNMGCELSSKEIAQLLSLLN